MKNCGLCLQPAQLVKSHIIAKSLMFLDEAPDKPLVVLSNVANAQPVSRSPAGVWSRILCSSCEDSFKSDDDFLLRFVQEMKSAPTTANGAATDLSGFDLEKLRRAILSVLFRAHLSDHEIFHKVDIGTTHYESLRTFLLARFGDCPSVFAVFLRHLPMTMGRALFDPFPEKWGGVRAYRLYLPYVTAMIKVDQRTMPHPWPRFALVTGNQKQAIRAKAFSPSESKVASLLSNDANAERIERIFGRAKAGDSPIS
ncbi:MAG: hypothetical protein HOQ32_08855 [Lysobacter sp.]|nr:hypothetical protein [Lysobacter sp.]